MTAQRWPRVWTQGLTPTTPTPMPLRRAFGQHVSETAARPLTPRPPEGPLTHSDPLRQPGPTACSGVRAGGERGGGSRVCLGPFLRGVKRERGAQSQGAALGRVGEQRCRGLVWGGTRGPRGTAGAFVSALRPGRAANARVCSHSARAPRKWEPRGAGAANARLWCAGSDHSPDSACPRRPCPLKSDLAGASGRRAWDDNPL